MHIRLRYLIERRESWSWYSRGDCWVKDIHDSKPRLQVATTPILFPNWVPDWQDVKTETVVVQPAGPEPT